VRADLHLRVPLDVEAVRETMNNIQAGCVSIHEPQRGTAQSWRMHQSGECVFAKGSAARADHGNGGGKSHFDNIQNIRTRVNLKKSLKPNIDL